MLGKQVRSRAFPARSRQRPSSRNGVRLTAALKCNNVSMLMHLVVRRATHTRAPARCLSFPPRLTAPRAHGLAFAEHLILQVCWEWPDPHYLKRIRTHLTKQGIRAAVAEHNTPALFDWLVDVASYQGISDTIAWTYMEQHGRVRWADIDAAFARGPACPKLASFEAFCWLQLPQGEPDLCSPGAPGRLLPAGSPAAQGWPEPDGLLPVPVPARRVPGRPRDLD